MQILVNQLFYAYLTSFFPAIYDLSQYHSEAKFYGNWYLEVLKQMTNFLVTIIKGRKSQE